MPPLLLLPSVFPSLRVFSKESALHVRWTKYWSFSFSPFNEYSALISFRMDWFDLLAVQGTLKSLLQHHRSKASILYTTTAKSYSFDYTNRIFVSKVITLLFNMLSRFVKAFLPRSRCLLILLVIYISSLEKYLFRSSAHFWIGLFVFLLLSCMSYLHILEIKALPVILFANIFSYFLGYFIDFFFFFCFIYGFFCCAKTCKFD